MDGCEKREECRKSGTDVMEVNGGKAKTGELRKLRQTGEEGLSRYNPV